MTDASTLRASLALWLRAHPRESLSLGLVGIGALTAAIGLAAPAESLTRTGGAPNGATMLAPSTPPPTPEPLLVRALPPETALEINARIPLAGAPNPAAKSFALGRTDAVARSRALDCLTQAVYYEAASESGDGQRAVAQVVLNRVRHPAYPASVCGVVYQGSDRVTGCQFTFTCDGSLTRAPARWAWDRARQVAAAALAGQVYAPVGNATHYHTQWVVPYWASSLAKSSVIGAHIFYRWSGGWGRPAAFVQRYSGREPDSNALRLAAASKPVLPVTELPIEAVKGEGGTRIAMRIDHPLGKGAPQIAHVDYVDRMVASSNLRWSLTGANAAAEPQKPLGRAPAAEAKAVDSPAQPAASTK